jgi:small subunit ribosomal protein S4
MIKKAYAPGMKGKRRRKALSEYGKELQEKQKIKNWYNLSESQFKKYVKEILNKKRKTENPAELLIQKLESRLDNAILRLGFASSRSLARQLVSHKHFLINGRLINIPSYDLKIGDKISVHSGSKKIANFQNLENALKKVETPSWLELDKKKFEGKVIGKPTLEEVAPPVEISAVFEFYSK